MILNDETEFCNKYARSSNDEMDVIPFREVSWRSYGWTHFGEFLQSLHHILFFSVVRNAIPLKVYLNSCFTSTWSTVSIQSVETM